MSTFKREKPHIRIDRIGREMTPIERAAKAVDDLDPDNQVRTAHIKAAFESIDTDQLTAIILRTELPGGIKVGHANKIALAVKNWLTGKDQQ